MQLRVFVFVELLLDEPSDPVEIFAVDPGGRGGGTGGLDFSKFSVLIWISGFEKSALKHHIKLSVGLKVFNN